jgi:hypothetical protein
MNRYLVRRGTKGWVIWDRVRKGPAIARHQELINFLSSQEAQAALEENLREGTLRRYDPQSVQQSQHN